ncbi:MAG: hypothetical protein ACM34K_11745 [Bacillota bacterium]
MKRTVIFFLILFSAALFAQRKTLIEGEVENGGFGAPVVKLSPVKNKLGILIGGYGGWLINHKFLLGGGGFGLVNNIKANDDVQKFFSFTEQPYLELGYGGLILEYYFNPDEILHNSVSLLIGGGGFSYRGRNMDDGADRLGPNSMHNADGFFVLEPGVSAELNVTKFMKISLSLCYRYVSGTDTYGIKDSDLSNVAAGVAFKFGKF